MKTTDGLKTRRLLQRQLLVALCSNVFGNCKRQRCRKSPVKVSECQGLEDAMGRELAMCHA